MTTSTSSLAPAGNLLTPQSAWKATLGELELQMTKATYGTWLHGTRVVRADDTTIVIGVKSSYAVDWMENRLKDTILRTLNAITDRTWQLEFAVVDEAAAPRKVEEVPDPPDTAPKAGQAHITLFEVDPTRGYIPVPHYASRFWRPYLGLVPFTLWEVLRSYGYFVSQGKVEWPTIEMIADTLGQGSRSTILGRAASGDRPEQDGAIKVLIQHRLITHWTRGEDRQTVHYFRVLDSLPVLAPTQVRQLSPRKQKEHEEFLKLFKGFNYDVWANIKGETLINEGWWE